MRRTTFVLGLASSAVAVALVALVYGIGSHRSPSSTVEPRRGEANQAPQTSSVDTELNESTEVVPLRSLDGDQNPTVTENDDWDTTGLADEETSRKMVRERATQKIPKWYFLLLEDLDLTPSKKAALLSYLIEDLIGRTTTDYVSGKPMDEQERSTRIAAIIGDAKRQEFLALERNLYAYGEVQNVQSMLQQNGVPVTDTQRDELLKILIGNRDQLKTTPPADVERDSIEYLEYQLTQLDEYERFVLELAPSVLSSKQVQYMFERYQALSYKRADALEFQRKARADPTSENVPLWYPAAN